MWALVGSGAGTFKFVQMRAAGRCLRLSVPCFPQAAPWGALVFRNQQADESEAVRVGLRKGCM